MFIPLSAFTAVAPPRMSIAVTITADRTKHDFQSTLASYPCLSVYQTGGYHVYRCRRAACEFASTERPPENDERAEREENVGAPVDIIRDETKSIWVGIERREY